jgi:hypothetical protein
MNLSRLRVNRQTHIRLLVILADEAGERQYAGPLIDANGMWMLECDGEADVRDAYKVRPQLKNGSYLQKPIPKCAAIPITGLQLVGRTPQPAPRKKL